MDQCLQHGIVPTAWSPLGGGSLFSKTPNEQAKRVQAVAKPICEKHNCGLDQLLLAWIMKHPSGIIPVLGTSKFNRVKDALAATEIQLSHEEWYDLWQASTGEEVA